MYAKTTFAGRFQAHSPYYEAQSLDSRRGRAIDHYAQLLRDNQLALPDYTARDASGHFVSADDQADGHSDYGPPDIGG